MIFNKK